MAESSAKSQVTVGAARRICVRKDTIFNPMGGLTGIGAHYYEQISRWRGFTWWQGCGCRDKLVYLLVSVALGEISFSSREQVSRGIHQLSYLNIANPKHSTM